MRIITHNELIAQYLKLLSEYSEVKETIINAARQGNTDKVIFLDRKLIEIDARIKDIPVAIKIMVG